VRVQLPEAQRDDEAFLKSVRVRATDGTMVPLGSIADFSWTVAPTKVERLNRQRTVNVTGGLMPNVSLGAVEGPLEKKLAEPGFLPPGVHLQAQGDTQLMIETFTNMGLAVITSFLLVYMLMVILYGSFIDPLIVMFSVPMAVVGALTLLSGMHLLGDLTGGGASQSLNIISMIGIIMLFGLVAKNGILLVDYSNTLWKRGMRVRDAVQQAAGTRFRPILMTTFAMVFGMLPLSLGFAEGAEWRQAMGTVIIGGLISSLILTLFLVPLIYNTWIGFFERLRDRKAVHEELAPVAAGGAVATA
jgi:HAE1 family hydrophobic/amphiphilic exporter-1